MMTTDERERADVHRWQMLAARVLVDVETTAATSDLPVLNWSITGAKLIGRPQPTQTAQEIRVAWQAWVDHLGAEVVDDIELSTGARILSATAERSPGRGHIDVTVLLLAEIPAYVEEGQ